MVDLSVGKFDLSAGRIWLSSEHPPTHPPPHTLQIGKGPVAGPLPAALVRSSGSTHTLLGLELRGLSVLRCPSELALIVED